MKEEVKYAVNRPVYSHSKLVVDFGGERLDEPETAKQCLSKLGKKCECSGACVKSFLWKRFPFVSTFANYKPKTDLVGDIIAGLTVGIMQIPQGMAYSMLAGLDPVYGLYTAFFPVLIYFVFGTSRHISQGSSPIICLMIGSTIDKLCKNDQSGFGKGQEIFNLTNGSIINGSTSETDRHLSCEVSVATAVTFLTGGIQFGLGLLRLGFVTVYLSEPLTRGYTTGAAVHVLTSQIKYVFGISVPRYSGPLKIVYTYIDLFSDIASTNLGTLCLSLICIVIIFLVKQYANPPVKKALKAPIPIDLIIVIAVTVLSYYMDFYGRYQIKIVGDIPVGIPPPRFPPTSKFESLVGDAFVIAIVSFAISMSMAHLFARKYKYTVDSSQELIAHGASNMFGSSFLCYVMSVSLSRSMVQESAGGKSQLVGLIQSSLIVVVILVAADLFYTLPNCVLASIIIVALKGMFMQATDIKKLWKSSKWDLSVWLVTCLAAIITDIDIGLLIGVGWSFLTVTFRTQMANYKVLGNLRGTDLYYDQKRVEKSTGEPRVKIFCWEAPLNYANAEKFVTKVYKKVGCYPEIVKKEIDKLKEQTIKAKKESASAESGEPDKDPQGWNFTSLRYIIIDCSSVSYADSMGISALKTIFNEYKDIGIDVYLAACNSTLRQSLLTGKVFKQNKMDKLFPTIHDALLKCESQEPSSQSVQSEIEVPQINGNIQTNGIENQAFTRM